MLTKPVNFQQATEQCVMRFVEAYVRSFSEIPCGFCEVGIEKYPDDDKCEYCKKLKLWPVSNKNDMMRTLRSYNNRCITFMNTKSNAPLRVSSLRIRTDNVWIDFTRGNIEMSSGTSVVSLGGSGMHVRTKMIKDKDYVLKMFEIIIVRCFQFLEEIKNWIEENDEDSLEEFHDNMTSLYLHIYKYERMLPQKVFYGITIFNGRD